MAGGQEDLWDPLPALPARLLIPWMERGERGIMALQGSVSAGAERMRSLDSKLHFRTLPFRAGSFLIPSPLPSVWNFSAPQPVDQPDTSSFWAQRIPSGAKHPLHPKPPNPKNRSRAGFNPSLNDPHGIFPSAPLRLFFPQKHPAPRASPTSGSDARGAEPWDIIPARRFGVSPSLTPFFPFL